MGCLKLQYRSEQESVSALRVVHSKRRENEPIQKEQTEPNSAVSVYTILAITNSAGSLAEQRQFGSWGTVDYFSKGLQKSEFNHENSLLSRGYTGHEHFFSVGLIHMNGRMYDQNLGRFLSPDDHIQEPFSTQNYNRYSYVSNNPLISVDPDGEWPWPVYVRSFISTETTGGGLFRGDGRGASTQSSKQGTWSRVHSVFIVDPSARTVTKPATKGDPTVFFGIPTSTPGKLFSNIKVGTPEGSNNNISFSESTTSFNFSHSGKDPITPPWATPPLNVHAKLSFNEDLDKGILTVKGSFTGDVFPSTESFIIDQSGKTKLFLGAQKERGGIFDLFGDNKKKLFNVDVQIIFNDKGNFTGVKQGEKTYSVDDWNKKVQIDFNK